MKRHKIIYLAPYDRKLRRRFTDTERFLRYIFYLKKTSHKNETHYPDTRNCSSALLLLFLKEAGYKVKPYLKFIKHTEPCQKESSGLY